MEALVPSLAHARLFPERLVCSNVACLQLYHLYQQHSRLRLRTFGTMSAHHTAKMPAMMYGTAGKKERTADLVYEAIKAGFRGIDTAAMERHYNEKGAGEGIRRAVQDGLVTREDLWASFCLYLHLTGSN
jgi:predicted aldo/keto reductase-like oxidoreductase